MFPDKREIVKKNSINLEKCTIASAKLHSFMKCVRYVQKHQKPIYFLDLNKFYKNDVAFPAADFRKRFQ